MISDEEIQELRRAKPSLQEAPLRALAVALKDFQACQRFELLRALPLNQFLKGASTPLKKLKEKTLGEIVILGAAGTVRVGGLTNASVKKVTEIFFRLQSDPASSTAPTKAKVFSLPHLRAVPDREQPRAVPPMSSVEAEEKLESAIRRLRRSAVFDDIADNRLGDFWDKSLISAPFEESITFRQLVEMKVRALLEKRSFGPAKIQGVLKAVDNALAERSTVPVTAAEVVPTAQVGSPVLPSLPAALHFWPSVERRLPSHALMLLKVHEYEAGRSVDSFGPLARLVREIPQKLMPMEYLAAWYLQDHHEDLIASMLVVDRTEVLALADLAYKKLDRLISGTASELRSYWEIALRGPGIGSEKLIEIFREPLLDENFQIGLCQMLLSSTGARHPIVFGEDLGFYWSKSPSALQMSITALIASLPKSDEALREEIDALFPFFEKDAILSILRRQAFFKEKEKVWVKRGGDVA